MSALPYVASIDSEHGLRTSVAEAAMTLGPKVTDWMFANAVPEDEEDDDAEQVLARPPTPALVFSSASSEDSHLPSPDAPSGRPAPLPGLEHIAAFEHAFFLDSPFVVVDDAHAPVPRADTPSAKSSRFRFPGRSRNASPRATSPSTKQGSPPPTPARTKQASPPPTPSRLRKPRLRRRATDAQRPKEEPDADGYASEGPVGKKGRSSKRADGAAKEKEKKPPRLSRLLGKWSTSDLRAPAPVPPVPVPPVPVPPVPIHDRFARAHPGPAPTSASTPHELMSPASTPHELAPPASTPHELASPASTPREWVPPASTPHEPASPASSPASTYESPVFSYATLAPADPERLRVPSPTPPVRGRESPFPARPVLPGRPVLHLQTARRPPARYADLPRSVRSTIERERARDEDDEEPDEGGGDAASIMSAVRSGAVRGRFVRAAVGPEGWV